MSTSTTDLVRSFLTDNFGKFANISEYIFNHPEIRFLEYSSSEFLADQCEKEGFEVERGVAGIETAFVATKPMVVKCVPSILRCTSKPLLPTSVRVLQVNWLKPVFFSPESLESVTGIIIFSSTLILSTAKKYSSALENTWKPR